MSSYAHFFIRSSDRLLPIATYTRSSMIYQCFSDYLPYEKARPLDRVVLSRAYDEACDSLQRRKDWLPSYENRIKEIATFNNSIEEKEEAIFEVHTYIDEAKEDIEGFQTAKNFIRFLLNMLDEAEYSEDGLDVNKYLYAGIECGIPTLEEVDSEV